MIGKDATVDFKNQAGKVTHYTHATFAGVMEAITGPLTQHGFSLAWEPASTERGGERARTQEVAERVATQAAKNGAAWARGDEGSFPSVKDLVRLHCGPETAEEREPREARAAVCAAVLHRTDVPWQLVERLRAAEKAKSDAAERSGR